MRKCPIFFRPEISASTESYFTYSSEPRRIVEDWLERGDITTDDITFFSAVSVEGLYGAHLPKYVDGVLSGKTKNGFGNRRHHILPTVQRA
jgi:hypothetical protein